MFKGKVKFYKNINGKIQEIEKEFDNEEDYKNFVAEYPGLEMPSMRGYMSLPEWDNWDNLVDNIINRRLGRFFGFEEPRSKALPDQNDVVDIGKYEAENRRIEQEKQAKIMEEKQKERKIQKLEDTIARLKEYKKTFKAEGRKDFLKDLDADIKKVGEELSKVKG